MRVEPILFLFAATALAAPQKFSSGPGRTNLIELYTSEGCSSCPPAEKILGELRNHPGLWRDFVPVAFHVVYWDHLGWRDRFASKTGTEREYAYVAEWGSGSVYTPCFVRNGAEWRIRFGGGALERSTESAGVLAAEYAGRQCRVTFIPASDARDDYEAHAAILGGGITSAVRAGENEGHILQHEFVVLVLGEKPLRNGAAKIILSPPDTAAGTRHALAIWITRRGSLAPVQAAGGWLAYVP